MTRAPAGPESSVRGTVDAVFYTSPTFTAGRLRVNAARTVSFAGALMVRRDDAVVLHGTWEMHPKFGKQLKVSRFEFDQKLTVAGLAKYLANHPALTGIGPVRALRIAEAFTDDFDRVIDEEPERVAELAKVPVAAVQTLREEWLRTRALNASYAWLAQFELTHFQMTALITKFGNSVIAALKADPYQLAGAIPGFGFKRIDLIARKLGTPKDHPGRIRAGLMHCVIERLDQGDCWVDYEALIQLANGLLVMDYRGARDAIETALETLTTDGTLACVSLGGRFLVALPTIADQEHELAQVFTTKLGPNPHFTAAAAETAMAEIDARLNDGQQRAVAAALGHNLVLVSGGAGAGKTFLIRALTELYEHRQRRVVHAAPTGKAAKRIEQLVGRRAHTIHRLLGYNGHGFTRGLDDPVDADVVVIDEVSMVDVSLAWHLFRAIDFTRTCVVLVGDHNQLPPVGPGNLLRDLIDRQPIPTVILDQVIRQAGALKENSIAVLRGDVRRTAEPGPDGRSPWVVVNDLTEVEAVQQHIFELFDQRLVEQLEFDLLSDIQLLTPTRKGPLGVDALNVELQRLVQKKAFGVDAPVPRAGRRPDLLRGDRVIQTRNNYDLAVMNGAIGSVTWVGPKRGELTVRFEDQEVTYSAETIGELSLAYALTIHRTQGSEFPCVVLVMHKSHAFMHHRNLFYTGVTRAQQVVIVVGDHWGMRNCAEREQVEKRKTFLSVLDLPRVAKGQDS